MTRRYRYGVNRSFGDPRVYRNFFQAPFRIAIDVSLDVGPNQERVARERVLTCGTSWRDCAEVRPATADRSTRPDSAEGPSRRAFAVTDAGARSLALTRATRERLWSGVKLQRVTDI